MIRELDVDSRYKGKRTDSSSSSVKKRSVVMAAMDAVVVCGGAEVGVWLYCRGLRIAAAEWDRADRLSWGWMIQNRLVLVVGLSGVRCGAQVPRCAGIV